MLTIRAYDCFDLGTISLKGGASMQFVGAEGSGMSLLVKITSESEAGGRAGGAG